MSGFRRKSKEAEETFNAAQRTYGLHPVRLTPA